MTRGDHTATGSLSPSSTKQMANQALGAVDAQAVPRQGIPDSPILSHVSHWSGGADSFAVGQRLCHVVGITCEATTQGQIATVTLCTTSSTSLTFKRAVKLVPQPQLVILSASRPLLWQKCAIARQTDRQPDAYKLVPAPSPMTKPSLSLSQGLDAFVGSSLRLDKARQAMKPPTPEGMIAASAPPASMRTSLVSPKQSVLGISERFPNSTVLTITRRNITQRNIIESRPRATRVYDTDSLELEGGLLEYAVVAGGTGGGDVVVGAHEPQVHGQQRAAHVGDGKWSTFLPATIVYLMTSSSRRAIFLFTYLDTSSSLISPANWVL
ncbi:MAG: hypothetical protein FRX49_09211 [Trebouxia sp. A1-2]|nr:MAG: hypothetical protein FRX49_09211 [Trebouxia sp. A1-2]